MMTVRPSRREMENKKIEVDMIKVMSWLIGTVLIFCLITMLFSGCYTVPPGHRTVLVFMGKPNPDIKTEGFGVKLPFLTRAVRVSLQQQSATSKAVSFSTDLQAVILTYTALYTISPDKVLDVVTKYQEMPFEILVAPRIQEAIKQVVAKYKAEEVVRERTKVKKEIFELIGEQIGDVIKLQDLIVINIDLSDELEKAIESKQVTEQQAQAKQYELQKAVKDAEITIVNAKAEAEAVKIKGEALANSPKVIDLEIAKRWNGQSPQSVVTSAGGANVLLPLR